MGRTDFSRGIDDRKVGGMNAVRNSLVIASTASRERMIWTDGANEPSSMKRAVYIALAGHIDRV